MKVQSFHWHTLRALAVATAVTLPSAAIAADERTIPASVVEQLSRDLADLQKTVHEGNYSLNPDSSPALFEVSPSKEVITVTEEGAPVRRGAAEAAPSLINAKVGQEFQVIDRAGDWYAVSLPKEVNGVNAGWVNASSVVPMAQSNTGFIQRAAETALQKGIEKAAQMKDAYADNPYVSISGFSVSVGTDTSISMSFEFK